MNISEYLENLFSLGIVEKDLPELQPVFQKRIWDRIKPGDGSEKLAKTIADLKKEDNRFSMEGGSWTNNISWVQGYDSFLGPMEKASALFYEKVIKPGVPSSDPGYRNALFHLLTSQTSCYRYWGEGTWTNYGKEIVRRLTDIINFDIKPPKIANIGPTPSAIPEKSLKSERSPGSILHHGKQTEENPIKKTHGPNHGKTSGAHETVKHGHDKKLTHATPAHASSKKGR